MRVKITLSSEEKILLTSAYNRVIQGLIYSLLESNFRNELHDRGFSLGKRKFKLFTFSRLYGNFIRKGNIIEFDRKIIFFVSSPVEKIIEQISKGLLNGKVQLETNTLDVESIDFVKKPTITSPIYIRTLSPITTYSTLYLTNGSKKTYYYSPHEDEFMSIIRSNLIKKATILNVMNKGEFQLEPMNKQREVFLSFKGTLVRGWIGTFKATGDVNLISVGYEAGLGCKNSAGFGMIEVLNDA
jgi:CRISPR-associated endoribonuclease Cas6